MTHPTLRLRLALAVTLLLAAPGAARAAPPWARFEVPDSALAGAIAATRTDPNAFENAWNALLVAELRWTLARSDSAARLMALERRVAAAEPGALGSRIAAQALALRGGWNAGARRRRVGAAVEESLAVAARAARDVPLADSLFRAAIAGYRALGERRRTAWLLGSLGSLRLVAGDNEAALAAYVEALAARRALGDPRLLGNTLNDLGQTHYVLGRYPEAYRYLLDAAALRDSTAQLAALGNTLGFLGSTLGALGRPDSARLCFRRAIELSAAQADSARLLAVLVNYTSLLADLGDRTEALEVSRRGREIALARGDDARLALLERNLGELLRRGGRYTESAEHYAAARALALDQGDAPMVAKTLCDLGRTLELMGDADRARRALERALALADSLEDPRLQSTTLCNMADVAWLLDDLGGGERLARRGVERADAAGDSLLTRSAAVVLGNLLVWQGRYDEAVGWFDRALAALPSQTPEQEAAARLNRAVAWHLSGRLDDAEREYRVAVELARRGDAPAVVLTALSDLGDVAERRGDFPEALSRYGLALAMADSLRSMQRSDRDAIKMLADRSAGFEAMIHLLGKLDRIEPDSGYAERAFDWAERSRARAFLDLAAGAGATARAAEPVGLREAQRLLAGDRQALLEYSVGDSSTSLWIIRKSRWAYVRLPARGALRARVLALRRSLGDPARADGDAARGAAHALYQAIVAPAEPWLAGVDRLIVSPDGPLALIPFEALITRAPSSGALPRGAYLGERFAVSYTPSASALALLLSGGPPGRDGHGEEAAGGAGGIVAVGDPAFGDRPAGGLEPLPRLPATAAELAVLATLGRGREHAQLEGAGATRSALLALPGLGRAEVVHIATHGSVNEAEPEHSGLWLAPDEPDGPPSRIEVGDILRLRLTAELVTLSACETGLGRLERGEGVVGLTRAFLAAGSRSALVSLWSVNDRSTATLMESFYRRALSGRDGRDVALAEAKRAMLAAKATRSPYYWAPFILTGASGPLR